MLWEGQWNTTNADRNALASQTPCPGPWTFRHSRQASLPQVLVLIHIDTVHSNSVLQHLPVDSNRSLPADLGKHAWAESFLWNTNHGEKEAELLEHTQPVCYFDYHEGRHTLRNRSRCIHLLQKLLEKAKTGIFFKKEQHPPGHLQTSWQS